VIEKPYPDSDQHQSLTISTWSHLAQAYVIIRLVDIHKRNNYRQTDRQTDKQTA